MTQADLAAHLRLPQSAMSRRMGGQTPFRLPELEATAALLGMSVHDLLPDRVSPQAVPQ